MRGISVGRVKGAMRLGRARAGAVSRALVITASMALLATGGSLLAQSGLAQLGLTESEARRLFFEQVQGRGIGNRRSEIATVGHRAFHRLPRAARGPAATALFAWARAYAGSPAFKTAYEEFRKGAVPASRTPAADSVDTAVKAQIDEILAGIEQIKASAAALPPADRAPLLEQIKAQEAEVRAPQFAAQLRTALETERGERTANDEDARRTAEERYPADPRRIFARHLRAFLDDTADADFSARTISLTGGSDGTEFVDPGPRQKPVMWQLAVMAGPEATTAARVAAEAWLKEIER